MEIKLLNSTFGYRDIMKLKYTQKKFKKMIEESGYDNRDTKMLNRVIDDIQEIINLQYWNM